MTIVMAFPQLNFFFRYTKIVPVLVFNFGKTTSFSLPFGLVKFSLPIGSVVNADLLTWWRGLRSRSTRVCPPCEFLRYYATLFQKFVQSKGDLIFSPLLIFRRNKAFCEHRGPRSGFSTQCDTDFFKYFFFSKVWRGKHFSGYKG